MKTATLPASELAKYERIQGRKRHDKAQVARIRAAIRAGTAIDPVVVFETPDGKRVVSDGNHRLDAFLAEGTASIPVALHKGTRLASIRFGAKVNGEHPTDVRIPLRTSERKAYAAMILAEAAACGEELSSRLVGRECGLKGETVERIRRVICPTAPIGQSTERTGADGRTINVANIGKPKRTKPTAATLSALDEAAATIAAAQDSAALGSAWGHVAKLAASGRIQQTEVDALQVCYAARKTALEAPPADASEFDHSPKHEAAPVVAASPLAVVPLIEDEDDDDPDEPLPPTVFKTWDWTEGRREMDTILFDLLRRAPREDIEDLGRWLEGWNETAKEHLDDHRRAM